MTVVPEGVENSKVEAALETIKALGWVCVRGGIFSAKLNKWMVLCESREVV